MALGGGQGEGGLGVDTARNYASSVRTAIAGFSPRSKDPLSSELRWPSSIASRLNALQLISTLWMNRRGATCLVGKIHAQENTDPLVWGNGEEPLDHLSKCFMLSGRRFLTGKLLLS